MKKDWLNILTNLAVLVGLVMVVYELNQSQRMAMAEAYQSRAWQSAEAYQIMAESAELAEIEVKWRAGGLGALTEEERYRLVMVHGHLLARADNIFYQYEQGFIDEDFYEHVFVETIRDIRDRFRDFGGRDYGRASFQAEVDRILAGDPTGG